MVLASYKVQTASSGELTRTTMSIFSGGNSYKKYVKLVYGFQHVRAKALIYSFYLETLLNKWV